MELHEQCITSTTHSCTKASETGACTEHTRLRVRNYIRRALRARMKFVPSKHAEHTHQELMRTRQELMHLLSVHVRNWCIPWVYTSVLYAYALGSADPAIPGRLSHYSWKITCNPVHTVRIIEDICTVYLHVRGERVLKIFIFFFLSFLIFPFLLQYFFSCF
jgi:hypothetical protein